MKFHTVRFVTSVTQLSALPFLRELPEIAVIGRSNVGKSTLLNHLFHTKDLVKTSSTPGKTRALNFFIVDEESIYVDMPGFGYASVSFEEKKRWATLIEGYLNGRSSLKVLLYLFDIRRKPTLEDHQMVAWMQHRNLPTILVLTKVDKLNRSQRIAQTKKITSQLPTLPFLHYSALKNEGRKELIIKIRSHLHVA